MPHLWRTGHSPIFEKFNFRKISLRYFFLFFVASLKHIWRRKKKFLSFDKIRKISTLRWIHLTFYSLPTFLFSLSLFVHYKKVIFVTIYFIFLQYIFVWLISISRFVLKITEKWEKIKKNCYCCTINKKVEYRKWQKN